MQRPASGMRALTPVLMFIAPFYLGSPAYAEEKSRTLSLSAQGVVNAKPDMASISTGVTTEAEDARTALDNNNAAMKRVISSLKAEVLEDKDIQTSNFSVRPKYRHFKDGNPPVISGYHVSNSVHIVVRDLKKLGEILDKIVTLGSNQIGGITFSISKPEEYLDEARKQAVKKVTKKAELYAEATGVKLGAILRISEDSSRPSPRPVIRAMKAAPAESVPIETGQQALQVSVRMVWEIE